MIYLYYINSIVTVYVFTTVLSIGKIYKGYFSARGAKGVARRLACALALPLVLVAYGLVSASKKH